jgi:hypothetical protein
MVRGKGSVNDPTARDRDTESKRAMGRRRNSIALQGRIAHAMTSNVVVTAAQNQRRS